MRKCTALRPEESLYEYIDDLPCRVLAPWFRVYAAILRKADLVTNTLTVDYFPEFGFHSGYTRVEMDTVLHNLSRLGLITVSVDGHKGTIRLHDLH